MRQFEENREAFVKALEASGWYWEGQTIFAPHRTIWFSELDSWLNDIADFQERMKARRDKIKRNRQHHTDPQQHENAVEDAEGLLGAIAGIKTESQNRL